jgi:transcriptional regulator with XRE-family HTH domain
VGDELRAQRERAGLKGTELAELLGWSPGTVAHLEAGSRGTSEAQIAYYLGICGTDPATFRRVLDLHGEKNRDCLVRTHEPGLPDELRTLIRHESTATTICHYESLILHGTLQTIDYARGLITQSSSLPPAEVAVRVEARMARQQMLRRANAPHCSFFIYEPALHTVVGSRRVMEDQMMHLVLMANWRNINIRVIPQNAEASTSLRGQFMLMDYEAHRSVAYVENEVASLFTDAPQNIATYRLALERFDRIALDEEESLSLLTALAGDYGDPRGAGDAGEPDLA